ncbi:hypothetical protein B0H13DRAFT_1853596 [Mycena leptocephala]|nr:hypothetical protein B0H13DRAFT_1853596 [Mycena leptocephala]
MSTIFWIPNVDCKKVEVTEWLGGVERDDNSGPDSRDLETCTNNTTYGVHHATKSITENREALECKGSKRTGESPNWSQKRIFEHSWEFHEDPKIQGPMMSGISARVNSPQIMKNRWILPKPFAYPWYMSTCTAPKCFIPPNMLYIAPGIRTFGKLVQGPRNDCIFYGLSTMTMTMTFDCDVDAARKPGNMGSRVRQLRERILTRLATSGEDQRATTNVAIHIEPVTTSMYLHTGVRVRKTATTSQFGSPVVTVWILFNQPDFMNAESLLETICKARGFSVLFPPLIWKLAGRNWRGTRATGATDGYSVCLQQERSESISCVIYNKEIVRINCGIVMGPTYRRPSFLGGGFAAVAFPAGADWEPRKKPLRATVELEVAVAAV